jgi:hypothetical protein
VSIYPAILRTAGALVPSQQRAEWLAEWNAELWYVRRARAASAFAFCLGAWKDAIWLRRNSRCARFLESPLHCALFLALLASTCVLVTFFLPGGRNGFQPSPYSDAGNMVLISSGAPLDPTISFAAYQSLAVNTRARFKGLAFYEPVRGRIGKAELSIAHASGNLFALLDIPLTQSGSPGRARLVLSDKAWRKYFAHDPHIGGRVIDIGGQQAVVAGTIPADAWRLPGRMDAWLLEDKKSLAAALPLSSRGFAIGHLRTTASLPRTNSLSAWTLPVDYDDGSVDSYECESLVAWASRPFSALLTTLFCLCVFLPATTSLALGGRRFRQWVFLAVKVVCILPMLFCCGLLASAYSDSAFALVFFLAMFPGSVFAFRWVFEDQRRRCPVCLRLLSKPVGFGEASHMFLGWYGTELTCVRGHGLLRVPEIPLTYFSTQRWLELDDLIALRW